MMRENLMRIGLILASAALLAASGSLAAQESSAHEPSADSAVIDARPMLLPADLVPPATVRGEYAAFDHGSDLVPLISAVVGGIAGMFIGRWGMQIGCDENCNESGFYGLIIGGMAGTLLGWIIGGGEVPQPPPGRWP